MSDAPIFSIDRTAFTADPYPTLARMRREAPVAHVPELGAILLTCRADVWREEKRTDILSSVQPGGLMTRLMGENMMRKDGVAHLAERRALFPALSPRTVRDTWLPMFHGAAEHLLDRLAPQGSADLVKDYAMPLSGAALVAVTGLADMTPADMDAVSQAMIEGCANYAGDSETEARCIAATARIDAFIAAAGLGPLPSALSVLRAAGMPDESIRANIKLIISGGQNEPRDAIAGTIWALLTHPDQLKAIRAGHATWGQAFDEYARWMSPIGMSPRRIAQDATVAGTDMAAGTQVFLMFGSANRDEAAFAAPDRYDITRDTGPALPFGAGPHFCAGAAVARALICEVALPHAFARLPGLRLTGAAPFHGWAYRGPVRVPVTWDA